MPVRYQKKQALLEGHVSVEDAEALSQWLREHKNAGVHLGQCEQVHAAVLQTLLALKPRLLAPPADPWLAAVLGADSRPAAAA